MTKPELTEELVRSILAMNPHLRGEGESTKQVLAKFQAQQAGPPPAKAPEQRQLHEVIMIARRELSDATLEVERRRRALDAKKSSLIAARRTMGDQARELIVEAFKAYDPTLLKPDHQALVTREKAFLEKVRFSGQVLMQALKR